MQIKQIDIATQPPEKTNCVSHPCGEKENLNVDVLTEVPATPQPEPESMKYPISKYLDVRQSYAPSLNYAGDSVIYISNSSGIPQVWQTAFDQDGNPQSVDQMTFADERVLGTWFSPETGSSQYIFAKDVGGNDNMQLYLNSRDGGNPVHLTRGFETALHIFGSWSADGKSILFAANRRNPGIFDLYLQPIDGKAKMVWENKQPGYIFGTCFSPDGKKAMFRRIGSSEDQDVIEVDLSTGSERYITPENSTDRFEYAGYITQDRILLDTDMGSDFLNLMELDLTTGTFTDLLSVDWDIDYVRISPNRKIAILAVNEDGSHALYQLNLDTGEIKNSPEMNLEDASGVIGIYELFNPIEFSANGDKAAFSWSNSTSTADVYIWDLKAGKIDQATFSSLAGLDRESFVPPELIHYQSFDGLQIPAWYYPPLNRDDKIPTVLYIHGGPEAQYKPSFNFFIQYLLNNGYAVLAPNVRGSTGYGKVYGHLDDVEKRMDAVADLAYAGHWLENQPGVDADQLILFGESYGGFMVLAGLTTYPELWAAGVDIVGISNMVTFLENTSEYRRAHREGEYGSLEKDREFMESIAPVNYADRIVAPLMMIHGANDPRVPLGETEQIYAILKERDILTKLIIFEDEGHDIVKLINKLVAYPAIIDFLNQALIK